MPGGDQQEWERWRGGVDELHRQLPGLIRTQISALGTQLGQVETNLNGQLVEVRRRLGEVETQTRMTNGTVREHGLAIARIEGMDEGEERVIERTEHVTEVRTNRRLDRLHWRGSYLLTIVALPVGFGLEILAHHLGWL